MDITSLVSRSHERAKASGFWDEYKYKDVAFALEIAESLLLLDEMVSADRGNRDVVYSTGNYVHGAVDIFDRVASPAVGTEPIDKSERIDLALMLIASEVSEAMGVSSGLDGVDLAEELADIMIRTADLAGWLDIDLDKVISAKMDKNDKRPYRHGKKY